MAYVYSPPPPNPVRVARRHAARLGDHRDRRGDDRGDGAGYHGLHRLPPLAPAPAPSRDPGAAEPTLARRRKPSATAPPMQAAAPAAHAAGAAQDQSPVWGRPSGAVPGTVPGSASSAIVTACASAVSSTVKRWSHCSRACTPWSSRRPAPAGRLGPAAARQRLRPSRTGPLRRSRPCVLLPGGVWPCRHVTADAVACRLVPDDAAREEGLGRGRRGASRQVPGGRGFTERTRERA